MSEAINPFELPLSSLCPEYYSTVSIMLVRKRTCWLWFKMNRRNTAVRHSTCPTNKPQTIRRQRGICGIEHQGEGASFSNYSVGACTCSNLPPTLRYADHHHYIYDDNLIFQLTKKIGAQSRYPLNRHADLRRETARCVRWRSGRFWCRNKYLSIW